MKKCVAILLAVFLAVGMGFPRVDALVANEWAINSYIKIVSADFVGTPYNSTEKSIETKVNERLSGTLTFSLNNSGPGGAIYVVGATTSWGEHSLSYWSIGQFGVGSSSATVSVDVTAPAVAGTYHIIIAGGWEITAGQVMSATNWAVGELHWNDGNDIAGWNSTQIRDARVNGRAIGQKEMIGGLENHYYPADSLKVEVLPVYEPPVADAGPDQVVYEGNTVQFNGTGSRGSSFRGVLLSEDFEDGNYDGWNIVGGTPSIVSGSLDGAGSYMLEMVTGGEVDGAMMYSNPSSLLWSNYTFEITGRITDGNERGKWYYLYFFWYSGSNTDLRNCYEVVLKANPGKVEFSKRVDGLRTVLNSSSMTVDVGTVYHVIIEIEDGQIEVFVNDDRRLGYSDKTHTQGTIGFSTRTGGGSWTWVRSHFDDINVQTWVRSQIVSYEWDFDASVDSDGDGNYTNDVDASGPTPTHVYYDDGVYTVTLTMSDSQGFQDTDQCNITVLNIPPTAEWTSRSADGTILNPPYPEGKEILFEAIVYDPGIYDTFTYDWDFGDGTILLDAGPLVTHTYGDNDTYMVILKVTDDDGGVGIDDTPPLLTTNENPVASISIPRCPFFEGAHACPIDGFFVDPGWLDTHSAVWDFGDGEYEIAVITEENEPPDATGTNFTTHQYGDDGIYNVTFTVIDDDGGMGTAQAGVSVYNLPPSISVDIPSSVSEGKHFSLGITATDPGSDDLFIDIDWGDGTSETETFYNNGIGPDPPNSGPGTFPFTIHANFSHVYGDDGNFNVTLAVKDDDGGSANYTTTITVNNVAPTIAPFGPFTIDEGSPLTLDATATDPGSDDLIFTWEFELGPTTTNKYYNDGMGPDPYPSPGGTYPFQVTDTMDHTYGDNGVFNVTLTVKDDDGGTVTHTTTITVNNVAPTIEPFGPLTIDEGSPLTLDATGTDPGSDDLTFTWEFELGPTVTNTYYNDGNGPDPYPSPEGIYPFTATDTVQYTYGDNGVFNVTLTVEDDDGGSTTYTSTITVDNVAPTIADIKAYIPVNFTLRIAGEKWHNVEVIIYEDGTRIGYAEVTRYPGNPDEQTVSTGCVKCDITKTITALVLYTPEDDPINGQMNGANPVWLTLTFEDGSEIRLKHTFNVQHPETWEWNVHINPYMVGHEITFEAAATDPGSDDLTFTWNWGDGSPDNETICFNDGVGPDPYPSPGGTYPFSATDVQKHTFTASGVYTVTLTVEDDDGGVGIVILDIMIP